MTAQPSLSPGSAVPQRPDDAQRRFWLLSASAAGGMAAVATAVPFVSTLAPSERARAAGGPVTVDISGLAPGEMRVVEWRGKPVWVLHRSPEMLASLGAGYADLADPDSTRSLQPDDTRNPTRSVRPEIFVAIGICTHLGCSPTAVPQGSNNPSLPADWPGGFFCPCHGSSFDGAGRVYRNKPAPTNLEIPPHRYVGDSRIVIGDTASA